MRNFGLLTLSVLLAAACNGFTPVEVPGVSEVAVDEVGMDCASVCAVVEKSDLVKKSGFVVSDTTRYDVKLSDGGMLELKLTGLKPGTDYHVSAYVGNGVNTIESAPVPFRTKDQFPDMAFREYVLSNYDLDGDGFISESEAAVVTELSVPAERMYEVKSAEGVALFRNLGHLSMTGSWEGKSGLQSLDLSGMTRLRDISLMWGGLRSLTLPSGLKAVRNLFFDYNFLEEIDFKDLEQADFIQFNYNEVESVDLGRFVRIDQLSCIGNRLKELDLSSVKSMGCLLCRENPDLKIVRINSNCDIHQLEVDPWTTVEYVD